MTGRASGPKMLTAPAKKSKLTIGHRPSPVKTGSVWRKTTSMYLNRTLLLPTRPGPPRPGSLPMYLTTGRPTCGLPHRQTVILSTILCGAFWRVKWTADPTTTRRLSRQPSGMPWSIWTGMPLPRLAPVSSPAWSKWWLPMVVTLNDFSTLYTMWLTVYKISLQCIYWTYKKCYFYYLLIFSGSICATLYRAFQKSLAHFDIEYLENY